MGAEGRADTIIVELAEGRTETSLAGGEGGTGSLFVLENSG